MTICSFINFHFNSNFNSNEELPFSVFNKSFRKGDVISKYEEIEKRGYFLKEGIVQAECLNKKLEMKIVDFCFPNSFFNAYLSFISQKPSKVRIVALTDVKTEYVRYEEISDLYETSLFVNKLGRKIAEMKVVQKTNREIDFLTKSAKEKYVFLLEAYPDFVKEIPSNKLALYLGIHAESLSRIKKELYS